MGLTSMQLSSRFEVFLCYIPCCIVAGALADAFGGPPAVVSAVQKVLTVVNVGMGKPRILQIHFDNNFSTYFGGQYVTGRIYIENDDDITNISGITVKIFGQAKVLWNERRKVNGHNRQQYIRSDELYLAQELYVHGNGTQTFLPAGHHAFTFSFNLPINIPSSFEGLYGHVRYFVKSTIVRGLLKFDYSVKEHFTVNSLLDLNREPNVHLGVEATNSKSLCCFCCRSGPISAIIRIPRTGFAAGQIIHISGEVDNKSNSTIKETCVKLIQTITFHTRSKSRSSRGTVCVIRGGEIRPGNSYLWNEEQLVVPPLPPSRLDFCSIIDINYSLEFHADPIGVSNDLVVSIPVLIGSIPIVSTFQPFQNQVRHFDPFRATLPHQLNAYPHLPIPTYEQFICGVTFEEGLSHQAFEEEDDERCDFFPSYITWKQ